MGQDAATAASIKDISEIGAIDIGIIDPVVWPIQCKEPSCPLKCQTLLIYPAKPCECPKWECIPCPKVIKCQQVPDAIKCPCKDGSDAGSTIVKTPCPERKCNLCTKDCPPLVCCLYGEDWSTGCQKCLPRPCTLCPPILDCKCKQLNRNGCWECINCPNPCKPVDCLCKITDPATGCDVCVDQGSQIACPRGQCSGYDDNKCPKCGPCCPELKNCCVGVYNNRTGCVDCVKWQEDCPCGRVDPSNNCSACLTCCPTECPCGLWYRDPNDTGCPKCLPTDVFLDQCKEIGCTPIRNETGCPSCNCCPKFDETACKCGAIKDSHNCSICADNIPIDCSANPRCKQDWNGPCSICVCPPVDPGNCKDDDPDLVKCIELWGQGAPTADGCKTCCGPERQICKCRSSRTVYNEYKCPIKCGPCDVITASTADVNATAIQS